MVWTELVFAQKLSVKNLKRIGFIAKSKNIVQNQRVQDLMHLCRIFSEDFPVTTSQDIV